ncbi:MAG: YopX family protein [Lachnospiraceae bacterium]|nr:YopX family protein [Lachnospiraceae bacterium]MCM1239973.1 YopX family protein [Lachnospiraceae bacterium]
MREILFRGKCVDETSLKGKWIEGDILHDGVTGRCYVNARGNSLNESDNVGEEGLLRFVAYEIDPATVCQYTGLTDKNGRKVFDGDTLSFCAYGSYYKGNVRIIGGNCVVHDAFAAPFLDDAIERYSATVIGNIFDSPGLIGGAG